jgi:hypothetical protein
MEMAKEMTIRRGGSRGRVIVCNWSFSDEL